MPILDAEYLAREFGDKITFLGGIDAQGILPHGTPQDVRDEVFRVRDILGPNVIISPSHEAILPDVPPENAAALAEAVTNSHNQGHLFIIIPAGEKVLDTPTPSKPYLRTYLPGPTVIL